MTIAATPAVAPATALVADVLLDRWLHRFGQSVSSSDHRCAAACITADGFWRDALAFTWSYAAVEGILPTLVHG